MPTIRLDQLLVQRGLAPSRQRARALVMAGRVHVDGRRLDKAGARVDGDARLEVATPPHPFVSRGGVKLAGALREFGVDPAGCTALDVGASTGGFTDCLLQHGAGRVIALDVGHGQIDWTLRNDPRVVVLERLNARTLDPEVLAAAAGGHDLVAEITLVAVDVSFISLALILPSVARLPAARRAICLVKPQFEVGRRAVGKGGIVRDAALHGDALRRVARAAAADGWRAAGVCRSPIDGADGNREFFLDLVRSGAAVTSLPVESLAAAIRAATGETS